MIRATICLTIAALVACAHCAEIELLPEELRIPRGESRTIEFDQIPTENTTVLLNLIARMDSPGLGGSMFFMDLAVNGTELIAAKTRTVCRLANRDIDSLVTPTLRSNWHGSGGWRILYSPDFEAALKSTFYEGNPYETVLDITDTVDPLAPNKLTITNTAAAAMAARLKVPLDLVIGKATITMHPGASPTMTAASDQSHFINRGEPGAGPIEYTGRLLPGGGFALDVAGTPLRFASQFSFPNAGLNRLVPAEQTDASGEPGWKVSASATDAGGQVSASGAHYTVDRTVTFGPRRVDVADTITNSSDEDKLGMLVENALDLVPTPDPLVRIAGNADPAMNDYYAPANPSVHAAWGQTGVGMICEDDVFRNQARLFFDGARTNCGLRTEMLLLGPGESHTLRWSVYPVASRDYYDFINLVREDWDSNYTVEGAWRFFVPDSVIDMPIDELKDAIDRLGIRYACSWGGWVDPKADPKRIGFGTEVGSDYWADYRRRLKEATAKLHEASPGIKVLIYYDTQRDTHVDADTRFADSRLTDAKGNQYSGDWGGRYSITWSMVATTENSFGKGLMDIVDLCMDEIGADGLYWDEMENVAYGYPYMTWAIPDGRSCVLDKDTYTIESEVGITTLLGEGHRLAVIDKVRAKGGTLMGNGPCSTRAILGRKVQRMVEIQHNDYWAYQGNLDSPLGYASHRRDFANVTRALEMATLLVGTMIDYQYDISKFLYPLTPIELHHGYLLGRERIVTMHSGAYGWPGENVDATLRVFDIEGKLRHTEAVTAGPDRVKVDLDQGEVAVIERN